MSEFVCKLAESETELRAALALRQAVFVMEQGVDAELETDGLDAAALHVVATAAGAVVGTARIRFPEAATAKVERMAVLQTYRRHGIGRAMLAFIEDVLRARNVRRMVLHAQSPVVAFYRSCGYRAAGATFLEAGMRHRAMSRRLV